MARAMTSPTDSVAFTRSRPVDVLMKSAPAAEYLASDPDSSGPHPPRRDVHAANAPQCACTDDTHVVGRLIVGERRQIDERDRTQQIARLVHRRPRRAPQEPGRVASDPA